MLFLINFLSKLWEHYDDYFSCVIDFTFRYLIQFDHRLGNVTEIYLLSLFLVTGLTLCSFLLKDRSKMDNVTFFFSLLFSQFSIKSHYSDDGSFKLNGLILYVLCLVAYSPMVYFLSIITLSSLIILLPLLILILGILFINYLASKVTIKHKEEKTK